MRKALPLGLMFILVAVVAFTFWDLPKTFFQQDEWWQFGIFTYSFKLGGVFKQFLDALVVASKIHFTPLSIIIYILEFHFFHLNFPLFAWTSIVGHILNAILAFIIIEKVSKNKIIGFFSALLFAVSSTSHQAVTWVAASTNTQGATFFSLLSGILFFKYISNKREKILYGSLITCAVAFLFKETFMPFFLIGVLFVFYSQEKKKIFKKILPLSTIFILSYLGMRIVFYIIAPSALLGQANVAIQENIFVYLFRIILLSIRIIPQSIFPASLLLDASETITRLAYPQFSYSDGSVDPYITEQIGYDLVCIILSAIFLGATLMLYWSIKKKIKKNNFIKDVLISIAIIMGNVLPIVLIPGPAGFASIIEPRHMYGGMLGASFLLVSLIYVICNLIWRSKHYIFFSILVFPIFITYLYLTSNDIQNLKRISILRKNFLVTIHANYPRLAEKTVFYTQSNQAYYGLTSEEKILPVQFGFGEMLLVLYENEEKFPACLFENMFLFDLTSEGYKYCQGRGFGYFRDYDKLVNAVRENKIPIENVISYSWKAKTEEFRNITKEMREKLRKDITYETSK